MFKKNKYSQTELWVEIGVDVNEGGGDKMSRRRRDPMEVT